MLSDRALLAAERDRDPEDEGPMSSHDLGSWRFLGSGAASGVRERFCEPGANDEAREAFSASRLATPSWIAFRRESESALRLVATGVTAGAGAKDVPAESFDEKSRLTVARPERGCRSTCIIADDKRNVRESKTR